MNNNIKVCPFCNKEIKDEDNVKFCPTCGTPHHDICWEKNDGCAFSECIDGHIKAIMDLNAICDKCGSILNKGEYFCSKCGTPINKQKIRCDKCGIEIDGEQLFCPNCGQKIDSQMSYEENKHKKKSKNALKGILRNIKKKPIKFIVIAVVIIAVIVSAIVLLPIIFKSSNDYLAIGDYVKAYEVANDDEKSDIIVENTVAVCSEWAIDNLKDSKSFDLRDGWYKANADYALLQIAGNNSYGNTVVSYWLFYYDEDDCEWKLWDTYNDLNEEEYSGYDDEDDFYEKLIHNMGLEPISQIKVKENKISKDSVERINRLFVEDKLNDVELLDVFQLSENDNTDD